MMARTIMADRVLGPGELAARARSRRLAWTIGICGVAGLAIGFTLARVEGKGGLFDGGTIPAWSALLFSAAMLGAMAWGTWRFHGAMDELEQRDNLMASALALNFYMGGYPIWFILWKGGLVPEPQHMILFVLTLLATALAKGWYKLRSGG